MMGMDLNILLWSGGTLFSLGIFAAKVGAGLGYGRFGRAGVALTLALYLALFQLVAQLAERLLRLLEPLLRGGPWLHGAMAAGMILWGIFLVMKRGGACSSPSSSLPLLIPCPVCLTAMTFSTWTALRTLPFASWGVGLAMGGAFSLLTLGIMALARRGSRRGSVPSLGMAMIVIGLYYLASLFLPARIEQAKGMYRSFLKELQPAAGNGKGNMILLGLLLAALLIGFFSRKGGNR
jgi:predicted transporter